MLVVNDLLLEGTMGREEKERTPRKENNNNGRAQWRGVYPSDHSIRSALLVACLVDRQTDISFLWSR